ncbi:twitch domain-containing radical SAM protein [Vicingaceae bacterium]|nr:twitch domain-containing radical SAM protein [Vicingaceae bacterium]
MSNSKVNSNQNSFCIMPWVHLHVSQNGNVIPCCQAPPHKVHRFGNVNENSVSENWKGEAIDSFRQKMLSNERDHCCKQCYLKEESGAKSLREITNEKFSTEVSEVKKKGMAYESVPIHFNVRFSNACNLKCRICGPWVSSQWHKDSIAMGMRKKDSRALSVALHDEASFFEQILPLLPKAKEFYFAGGEPLMMKQHYKVLDALIAFGNTSIRLSYNTNFSILEFKNYKVIDYWKQFKNIHVTASLDGEAEQGEFLRKNIKWAEVTQNRELCIQELPHLNFQIAPTACIFNVSQLPQFHKNWVNNGYIKVEDFIPNILIHPKEYQINVLPLTEQKALIPIYEAHLSWILNQEFLDAESRVECLQQFQAILAPLETVAQTEIITSFKEKSLLLDSLRNEDTSHLFKELNELF